MRRRPLIERLQRYGAAFPGEAALVQRFVAFVEGHPDCLLRTCRPGHVTASAFVLSADRRRCLLAHHRKLGKWLQPGGHVDGEAEVELAALREAREETGLAHLEFLGPDGGRLPLDLDVHPIPARPGEPEHWHWDVRYLLRAAPGQELLCSDESYELRWLEPAELVDLTAEESVLRLARKCGFLPG